MFGKSAFARHPTVQGDPGWIMPVGYGLSETCAFVSSHPSTRRAGGCRRASGGWCRVTSCASWIPTTGAPLGAGGQGELAVRGPTLMIGYVERDPADCFDADGFFHTGDARPRRRPTGYVHFDGRRTEMIKTGGRQRVARRARGAAAGLPAGQAQPGRRRRPTTRLDQIVVACIVLHAGADATEEDITAFLRQRVSAYKVPKRVLFFADGEIPMTSSDTKVRDEELLVLVRRRLAETPPTA